MKKQIIKKIVILLCFVCIGVLAFGKIKAYADEDDENDEKIETLKNSISEKENQLSDLKAQKKTLQAGKTDIQKVVNSLKASKKQINDAIVDLDAQVQDIQNNIESYNNLIETKENDIAEAEKALEAAEEEVTIQYEAMKQRIRFMYERGDSTYIEILFSANSFGDFLNKADYIEKLSEYDRNKLEEYSLQVEYTKACREELEEEKTVLEEAKKASMEEQENLNVLIDEKKEQIENFESDIKTKEQAIAEYDAELNEQTAIIEAVEAQVAAQKSQLEEATRVHYDGGMFVWPAPSYTRISDSYGWRMHPTLGVKKFHNGIDMASPGGSPILAAYDGVVVTATYSSSCGNYIMIDHGDGLYTIYMHASALYVSKGENVTAGQKIAAVGSTGRSTGNHLHFGVRYNGDYVDPNGYL